MRAVDAIAEILRREGVRFLSCFPNNPLIDAVSSLGIRPIVCRQERVGVNIADGFSRLAGDGRRGVFAMQAGPGAENAFAGVAQAYADSVPILLLPAGVPRREAATHPNFSAPKSYSTVTKWVDQIAFADRVPDLMRRAFTQLRSGRPGPVMLELPGDVAGEQLQDGIAYQPVPVLRSQGDPADVESVATSLVQAARPVIHAGQGVLSAEAWSELQELAELLQAPVMTTLLGKSAFPEDHPLALGSGGATTTGPVHHFLDRADVVFGIGCSFSHGSFSVPIPAGKTILHATADACDINKVYPTRHAIVGDAKLVLRQLLEAVHTLVARPRDGSEVTGEIAHSRSEWLSAWLPKLTSDETPINPYRVIWELMHLVDRRNTVITHDSGSPRNQLSPFWVSQVPHGYIGWGRSTQLGYGLGLAIGAKLAQPERLVINLMGDTAFGMVGLDFETAVRSGVPILTIVLNNFAMAIEKPHLEIATERYQTLYLGGNFARIADALGGYAQRVEEIGQIVPALRRAIAAVQDGRPSLVEFITSRETDYSK
ncbi:MAG: thiamine pyrophosphate-requiring protein [Chloroflexi bacterium]|nr:thiamine pyrophosphate-requiring protein [Chloroflexota bacterium]